MFSYIGKKIKGLTTFVCWVGIIASIVGGLVVACSDEDLILTGILVMAAGSLTSWISSFLLYGFGELIDTTMEIRDMLKRRDGVVVSKHDIPQTWFCGQCGVENSNAYTQCKNCGKYRS